MKEEWRKDSGRQSKPEFTSPDHERVSPRAFVRRGGGAHTCFKFMAFRELKRSLARAHRSWVTRVRRGYMFVRIACQLHKWKAWQIITLLSQNLNALLVLRKRWSCYRSFPAHDPKTSGLSLKVRIQCRVKVWQWSFCSRWKHTKHMKPMGQIFGRPAVRRSNH